MGFSLEKIKKQAKELEKIAITERVSLDSFFVHSGEGDWKEAQVPIIWSGVEKTWTFKKTISFPDLQPNESIRLFFNLGTPRDRTACESLLYLNGKRYFGFDVYHKSCILPQEITELGQADIIIEAFSGITEKAHYMFEDAEMWKVNNTVLELSRWLLTITESAELLADNDVVKYQLLDLLNKVYQKVDLFSVNTPRFIDSVENALGELVDLVQQLPEDHYVPKVIALGHSHIDLAYLWRIDHTRRKSIHTFSTVLTLMEQYEEFNFIQSQPQLYEYIELDAPDMFEQIQQRVKEGRWEVEGGMWVEADCNIPSGESLVRQFLYGMNYYREKFNKNNQILWLPDVFGYSYALPQLLKLCGIDYFMTTKISWNDTNRPVNDTFLWKGIDGSEVLTHFITTPENGETRYTYNGYLDPEHVTGLWNNYRQKNINDELLLIFGYGDGGGGPTEEMIEAGKRLKALPHIPKVEFGTALDYFTGLEERVTPNSDLPTWDGELYLEYHRGTYTSQAKNKRLNRYSEFLYRELEMWNSIAFEGRLPNQTRLDQGWKLILKNQFHDIIPGTGIPQVYEDSDKDYEKIIQDGKQLLDQGLTKVMDTVSVEEPSLIIFNSLPWERDESINYGDQAFKVEAIPSCGYKIVKMPEIKERRKNLLYWEITPTKMENEFMRIEFAENGQISSMFDKQENFQILAQGENGNILEVFEDIPLKYDNWNIDQDFQLKRAEITELVEAKVVEDDGFKGVVLFKWKWKNSVIEQRVIMYQNQRYLDFETKVDWQERQTLLKTAFPVNIRSSHATYDIQFGNVQRPTTSNTSWEAAQFETCAHKWIDLSEGGYGVSLINDCKYGHDVKGNMLRTTLIKSGTYPDPEADKGHHAFRYRFYPHKGDWREANTNRIAYEFNVPLQVRLIDKDKSKNRQGSTSLKEMSYFELDSEHVMLETVKKAEDGKGIIARFYEYGNLTGKVNATFHKEILNAYEVNLLEEKIENAEGTTNRGLQFSMKPYEIKSYRIVFV